MTRRRVLAAVSFGRQSGFAGQSDRNVSRETLIRLTGERNLRSRAWRLFFGRNLLSSLMKSRLGGAWPPQLEAHASHTAFLGCPCLDGGCHHYLLEVRLIWRKRLPNATENELSFFGYYFGRNNHSRASILLGDDGTIPDAEWKRVHDLNNSHVVQVAFQLPLAMKVQ